MRVLASGSSGNCTLITPHLAADSRIFHPLLLDLGLSPRRTGRMLRELGIRFDTVAHALLTHLDSDHFHPGWFAPFDKKFSVHAHRRHADRLVSLGMKHAMIEAFDEGTLKLPGGLSVSPRLADHDAAGVAIFRIEFNAAPIGARTRSPGPLLGFATDVGRVTDRLLNHVAGVDVLAIESNYCPRMQIASDRPEFLKRRIMGGSGHLSNAEAFDAVSKLKPGHVVLLHLSRQCNDPAIVRELHAHAGYRLTITSQFASTPWVPVTRRELPADEATRLAPFVDRDAKSPPASQSLFDWAAVASGTFRP